MDKERFYVRYLVDDDLRLNIPYNEFKKKVLENIWTTKQKDEFCRGNIIKVLHPTLFLSMCILLIFIISLFFICTFKKYYAVYIGKNKEDKIYLKNNNDNYENSDSDMKLINKNEDDIHSRDNKRIKFEKENNTDAKEMDYI